MGKGKGEKPHPLLQSLIPLVEGLAETFGPRCEVVLHDLRHLDSSIIAIKGGLTGRKVGGPVTDLVLRMLEDAKRTGTDPKDVLNYENRTIDGRIFKSSTIFIRDARGTPVGCLCINYDVTDLLYLTDILKGLCYHEPAAVPPEGERFPTDIDTLVEQVIKDTVDHNKPAALLSREERLALIKRLEDKGVFLVKGGVALVARYLGVSRYTVYNYRAELRDKQAIANEAGEAGL